MRIPREPVIATKRQISEIVTSGSAFRTCIRRTKGVREKNK